MNGRYSIFGNQESMQYASRRRHHPCQPGTVVVLRGLPPTGLMKTPRVPLPVERATRSWVKTPTLPLTAPLVDLDGVGQHGLPRGTHRLVHLMD